MSQPPTSADITVVGAGAAGLLAAITAARTAPHATTLLLDGSPKPGSKIRISGGGRCNVTHVKVTPQDYAGSSPNAIKKILKRFTVKDTINFFAQQGVTLKQEPTGKLFPTTDKATTIWQALLDAAQSAGVQFHYPCRVTAIQPLANGRFTLTTSTSTITTTHLIIATGGQSIPQTGSDGLGYQLVTHLGHQLTPRWPALVPLLLPKNHFLPQLKGITQDVSLTLWSATNRKLISFSGSLLCTHFGLSGPVVLDISRHFLAQPDATLTLNWLPQLDPQTLDQNLQQLGKQQLSTYLRPLLPDRLATALLTTANIPLDQTGATLTRDQRKALLTALTALPLPITTSRGFNFAEVTAGGVPLDQLHLKTMASRHHPHLYLCGEICDVDGRIGGFNFQWAWASGYVAGQAAGQSAHTTR
ncbi:MAG TPA: aminoacetone oxidase family FAD-binding enzyme [Anaerolineae bacterium]|nr:aminoacetone oxidase family FAD-binding enzyme [Anaerolineae bacterium]